MYKFQSRTFELRKLRPIRQMSAVSLVNLHGRSHTQPCKLRAVLRDIKGQSRVFCVYMRRIVHTTVMLLILHGTLETPLWCRLGSAGFPLWCPVKLPGVYWNTSTVSMRNNAGCRYSADSSFFFSADTFRYYRETITLTITLYVHFN